MKRASSKLAKKQTCTAKDGRRIKGLEADQKKSRADALQSADLLARMNAQQELLELRNEQLSESNSSLELSRHRYADLYNLSPVGYLTLDGRGCIREINQTASQMLGWSTSHLLGKPLLPHIIKQDRKVWLQHLWESRRSTSKIITTLQVQSKDGVVRKVQFATSRQEATGPHAKWCRTAMLDTTEKSDAQSALSASEAKFRLLAENMGEVFWFMELDPPRITYVSPAFEQIWGVPAAELYANNQVWMKAIHSDDFGMVHAAFHRWIQGESATFRVEYRVLTRAGQIRWIADRGIVIGHKDGKPHHLSGIARDVSERKQAEAELQLRNAELRANNDELERFNRAMVDRELRMIELKQEINALLQQTGQPPRYRVDFASPSLSPRNP